MMASGIPLVLGAPFWTNIPYRDSGVFQYVGWRLLQGDIAYRDVWDHKGPAIYYIDALGIVIGGTGGWGCRRSMRCGRGRAGFRLQADEACIRPVSGGTCVHRVAVHVRAH